jgi:ankyrin repeat protein
MKDGVSALMLASQEGHQQVVDVLLGHGANPHLQTEVQ